MAIRLSTLSILGISMLSGTTAYAASDTVSHAHETMSTQHAVTHSEHDHAAEADGHEEHDHAAEADEHEEHDHAAEADEHEEHDHAAKADEHEGHDHDEAETLDLSPAARKELGIVEAQAAAGNLAEQLTLYGETYFNAEATVHVLPLLNGSVKAVYKQLGDKVQAGDALALLESRELADAKSSYLAAVEQLALVNDDFRRKKQLVDKNALAQQQLFTVQQSLAEAKIRRQAAARKLQALGFSTAYIQRLPQQKSQKLTEYTLVAPQSGVIVEKHITRGEVFRDESRADAAPAFVISDLNSLWVDFSVYPQDLPRLQEGQSLQLAAQKGLPASKAKIIYIAPQIDRETRTALVRARLANPAGQYRAGLFVEAQVTIDSHDASVVVPLSAVLRSAEQTQLFVREATGYELRSVRLGREAGTQVEVLSGLQAGESYVAQGAFILKAEQDKAAFAHAGHAH